VNVETLALTIDQDTETTCKPLNAFKENTHESIKKLFRNVFQKWDEKRMFQGFKTDYFLNFYDLGKDLEFESY